MLRLAFGVGLQLLSPLLLASLALPHNEEVHGRERSLVLILVFGQQERRRKQGNHEHEEQRFPHGDYEDSTIVGRGKLRLGGVISHVEEPIMSDPKARIDELK